MTISLISSPSLHNRHHYRLWLLVCRLVPERNLSFDNVDVASDYQVQRSEVRGHDGFGNSGYDDFVLVELCGYLAPFSHSACSCSLSTLRPLKSGAKTGTRELKPLNILRWVRSASIPFGWKLDHREQGHHPVGDQAA